MWKRRSDAEIALIERRKQRQRLSPVGAFLLTVIVVFAVFLFRRNTPGAIDLTSPVFVFWFLVVFLLFYVSHVFLGRYELFGGHSVPPTVIARTMICPLCRTVQFDTETHSCACGGRLEKLEDWRWTDGEDSRHT
jgi:hypothetical protein